MSIVLALLAHIGWGVGDVFAVGATRIMGTKRMTIWRGVAAFVLATVFLLPFFWHDFLRLTPSIFALTLALSIVTLIGDFAFFEGFKVGNPTLVGVISASFVAVSVVCSVVFLGEQLSLEKTVVIGGIMAGVLLCLLEGASLRLSWGRGEIMALVTMMCWGVYYAFIKIPVRSVGWFVPGYLFLSLFPILLLVSKRLSRDVPMTLSRRVLPIFVASVLLTTMAEWLYHIAIVDSDVSFVAPIAGSYPALFVLLSSVVFREPLRRIQLTGIVLTVSCIIALGFLGG